MTQAAPRKILVFGASGTIGRATVRVLVERGHDVVAFVRPGFSVMEAGARYRFGQVTDSGSIARDAFCDERFDVVLSCLASRNGAKDDAWRIDYQANADILDVAKHAGVPHFILLSAICVQRPRLAFQHTKIAFENLLIESGLTYSIVRPTAFFKSLSGQVGRVKNGNPFLLFGNGELTACKPISDADLARFLADCIDRPELQNGIFPIGGPGDAITPKQQGEMLFALLGRKPVFRHVPVAMLDAIVGMLSAVGTVVPVARRKAELARIGRYYATESMLVLDPETGRYDAANTPSFGTETLAEHYRRMIDGEILSERGEHSVF